MNNITCQRHKKRSSAVMCALLKICGRRPKYAMQTMSALVISAMLKVLTSFAFNMLMLAIGFSLGYMTVMVDVHHAAKRSELYGYGAQIQQKVDELDQLDLQYSRKCQQIRDVISQLNMHLAHEERSMLFTPFDCKSSLGKKIWEAEVDMCD